jgi:hypothetical protein
MDILMIKVMTLVECCGKRFLRVLIVPQLGAGTVLTFRKALREIVIQFSSVG